MSLSERATRKQLIDKALEAVGWKPIVRYDPSVSRDLVALEEYPTANDPTDYALFHDGEPLAIVEVKKLAVGPQNVLKQAQRYARRLSPSPFEFAESSPVSGLSSLKQMRWRRQPQSSTAGWSKWTRPSWPAPSTGSWWSRTWRTNPRRCCWGVYERSAIAVDSVSYHQEVYHSRE
jgi:hypothetical protein